MPRHYVANPGRVSQALSRQRLDNALLPQLPRRCLANSQGRPQYAVAIPPCRSRSMVERYRRKKNLLVADPLGGSSWLPELLPDRQDRLSPHNFGLRILRFRIAGIKYLTPVCSPKCNLGSRRTKMPPAAPSYKRGGPRKRRSDGEDWIMGQPLTRFCAPWNPERRRCRRRIGSRARLKAPGTLGGIEVVPGWLEKLERCWGSNPPLSANSAPEWALCLRRRSTAVSVAAGTSIR
jgi:hypothetical protein